MIGLVCNRHCIGLRVYLYAFYVLLQCVTDQFSVSVNCIRTEIVDIAAVPYRNSAPKPSEDPRCELPQIRFNSLRSRPMAS